jgi:anaerobic selenocysteine-containing dehydrogenase
MAVQAGEQVLPGYKEGHHDRRNEFEIYRELGLRLGQKGYWPWNNVEQYFDYILAPMNVTFEEFRRQGGFIPVNLELRKYEKSGCFGTPTGKLELYSTIFEKLGYDPLPGYDEPKQSFISAPDLAKEYPFILTTGGRGLRYYHSQWYHIDSFRNRERFPRIQIHPAKAAELRIHDGDWVWIETPLGRVKAICRYFDGMDPRMVNVNHYGVWNCEEPANDPSLYGMWDSNVNAILDDHPDLCDPIGGGWPLRELLCKVYKA